MALSRPPFRFAAQVISACVVFTLIYSFFYPYPYPIWTSSANNSWQNRAESIINKAREYVESPFEAPYKNKFGELGERTKVAREWIGFLDDAPSSANTLPALEAVEAAIGTMYPFLTNSPKKPGNKTPFSDLRSSFVPGSRGIVIPTGTGTLRFATHLIANLREVLRTELAIQIVYSGDDDLPPEDREQLTARFGDMYFLDILTVVDDATVGLVDGGWAIKAFAALYSPFEEVLLLDADCVFVQKPELLLEDPAYQSTGALLFHDRLLWQHAFRERHNWYEDQIRHPSAQLNKSLVWTQDYAEEGDSGVVVLDKSRLDVLMGLLHIAWQNTRDVREEVTYKLMYGDKESWWFGLELSGAAYAFETHYAAMVGWVKDVLSENKARICSFVIGHVDRNDELFWYNGGLLKNKKVNLYEFGEPTHTMVDGIWEKSGIKTEMSCMVGTGGRAVLPQASNILADSIALAQKLDEDFGFV
ncbi:uncharacterized protein PgNI_12487 [Pyricularia grisea]|uniref:Uncharacterized protein n=1 Tax=Pyricularia grisea TaxID=148305 RepID=A0A6P8AMB3_PYRGI|nr:uncharacterized protein PgNI_12487 [Pyricularia grisea]TLD03171.1 hypothetical protein PgNI_12487 [Pyricularia grisea]